MSLAKTKVSIHPADIASVSSTEEAVMRYSTIAIGLFAGLLGCTVHANEASSDLREFAEKVILSVDLSPSVLSQIRQQNARNADLAQPQIQAMDQTWRNETYEGGGELIDSILSNDVSSYLKQIKQENGGLFTELFIMDNRGLNVGQSDVTSDYWQGDEDKWLETFLAGPHAIHISNVEFDESTQCYQVQASRAVSDPLDDIVLGAITVGINVSALPEPSAFK